MNDSFFRNIVIAIVVLWLTMSAGIFVIVRHVSDVGLECVVERIWEGKGADCGSE